MTDRPSPRHHQVLVVGSANLDLVATTARIPAPGETVLGTSYAEHPGGKGLNQAVAAARSGATTAMIAALGDDAAGAALLAVMDGDGVDRTSVRTIAGEPTGRALITVAASGENSIVVVPGANAALGAIGRAELAELPACDVVLAQLEVPIAVVVEAFRRARRAGARTVLNPAPAAELPAELVALCDVVIPNEHELELLGGVDAVLGRGAGAVIVTRGAAGADLHDAGRTVHQPAFAVDPVDTTAAGDAFCGGFAARFAAGEPPDVAMRWAAAAGALAATVAGAVPSLPHAEAIEALVSDAARRPSSPRG